jgi:LysM repeat protein
VVQPGENLFRIGLKFGSSADAIASASNIADPGQVSAGTMVLVPTPPPQGTYGYYVQSQDTVYSIARQFGMTVEQLTTLNNLGASHAISVGQILIITP